MQVAVAWDAHHNTEQLTVAGMHAMREALEESPPE